MVFGVGCEVLVNASHAIPYLKLQDTEYLYFGGLF